MAGRTRGGRTAAGKTAQVNASGSATQTSGSAGGGSAAAPIMYQGVLGYWQGNSFIPVDEPDAAKGYVQGGDNTSFLAGEVNQGGWIDNMSATLWPEFASAAKDIGESPQWAAMQWDSQWPVFLRRAEQEIMNGKPATAIGRTATFRDPTVPEGMGSPMKGQYFLQGEGWNKFVDYARSVFQQRNPSLSDVWEIGSGSKGGGRGGGGGRLPTEQEIRAQFDLDQLAAEAQNIWRGNVLDEHDDPRGLARQYVDAVVSGQGQQKLDFGTFVEKRVKDTARYKSIYKNKPDSMTPAQYLQPYFQSAQQLLGASDQAAGIAIGGAQFGASSAAFQSRLNRTDAATSSAPFINSLETRLGDLKGIFKG